jgi:ribosome-associated heat shock protein Hsp15
MTKSESERIDKFLWSVRLYKTRTIATEACRSKHVLLNSQAVKASANVRVGDKIEIKVPPIIRSFEVKALLSNRVSAKLVPDFITETTPQEAFEELKLVRKTGTSREKGSGRPTKKERRQIDKYNPYK